MEPFGKRKKRLQISFRITDFAHQRLCEVAELFNLEPSLYAKAVLYRDLGLYKEPIDQRRKRWRRKVEAEENI